MPMIRWQRRGAACHNRSSCRKGRRSGHSWGRPGPCRREYGRSGGAAGRPSWERMDQRHGDQPGSGPRSCRSGIVGAGACQTDPRSDQCIAECAFHRSELSCFKQMSKGYHDLASCAVIMATKRNKVGKAQKKRLLTSRFKWQLRWDSNPCFRLERAAS